MDGWINGCTYELRNGLMNEWINESVDEWMKERMNARMHEWMNELALFLELSDPVFNSLTVHPTKSYYKLDLAKSKVLRSM